jgi:bifunctional UDP-N-acetylglucosamine pyrophosphorylase/glucosamine-1-phosphate N-acetyltransferase
MATVKVDSFEGWKKAFFDFGRIIRDAAGKIVANVEKKDTTDEQKLITEVNPVYFCVDSAWLWKSLSEITPNNAQGEYYLTDLVKLACNQGHAIVSVEIPAEEALGVNTPEQKEIVEGLMK